jgi:hypothetical protein
MIRLPDNPVLRFALLAFGLLLVIGLIVDLNRMSSRVADRAARTEADLKKLAADLVVDLSTSGMRHQDAEARFAIAQLTDGASLGGPRALPFDVILRGPNKLELGIIVADVTYRDRDELMDRLKEIEVAESVDTHMVASEFRGFPAVERTCRLHHRTLRMLDFFTPERAFHFQFSTPPDAFEIFQPVFTQWLETLELP